MEAQGLSRQEANFLLKEIKPARGVCQQGGERGRQAMRVRSMPIAAAAKHLLTKSLRAYTLNPKPKDMELIVPYYTYNSTLWYPLLGGGLTQT